MASSLIQTKPNKENSQKSSTDISRISFPHFFFNVFMLGVWKVDGIFEFGHHLVEWGWRLQKHDKTATIAPRYHLKTTVILGYLAWKLYQCMGRFSEWIFMGYNEALAGHHLKRLKRYIAEIPEYFNSFQSKTNADTILHYTHDGCEFICEPQGLFSFKRGYHPKGLICDDILRDPEVKLDISQLKKIESIFFEQIMSMPTEELHVVGTPQDQEDLFTRLEHTPSFNVKRYDAEVDSAKKIALWPEIWGWEKLMDKKAELRERAYNKEFRCRPARSEEGYFSAEEIDAIINSRLKNYGYKKEPKLNGYSYGGFDIGKKRHPSHISIFCEGRRGKLYQVASIWLDGWDYTRQLDICKQIIGNFKVQRIYYDDTRAELEGFRERGELPPEMRGVNFTQKEKYEMAAMFEKAVIGKRLALLRDERQRRQILTVDNDLRGVETSEGHGDSFWSNALAMKAAQPTMENIRII